MTTDPSLPLFERGVVPEHLFAIPELDFSSDLFAAPFSEEWLALGLWTRNSRRDARGVESCVERYSVLIPPNSFSLLFDRLESVGNVLDALGRPTEFVISRADGGDEHGYRAYHDYEIDGQAAEPLVSRHFARAETTLMLNPDLPMFFELERRGRHDRIWWDPARATEAVRHRLLDEENLEIVEIRTAYLRRYLRARQRCLLVGHYRHGHLFRHDSAVIARFQSEDACLGAEASGRKAILQNWGLRTDGAEPFLQRRLHMWFSLEPEPVDPTSLWLEAPPFDPVAFTFQTRNGPVAPARWKRFPGHDQVQFPVAPCDFMDRIYFRQEVLQKYEISAGYTVDDDGSVHCGNIWGLTRSTARIGNALLVTAVGDFAEGVPFEEWPHWRQHAVPPPSGATLADIRQERPIPEMVNALMQAAADLDHAVLHLAQRRGVTNVTALWTGQEASIAARLLKGVYPDASDDDEFIKRATLTSTLLLDELKPSAMRAVLATYGPHLHLKNGVPLGSRNLLLRLALAVLLDDEIRPSTGQVAYLVSIAEGAAMEETEQSLRVELVTLHQRMRDMFAPLAFLYDLRTHGGLAHPPSPEAMAGAASNLGLPREAWHRRDFLSLLNRLTTSLEQIVDVFRRGRSP